MTKIQSYIPFQLSFFLTLGIIIGYFYIDIQPIYLLGAMVVLGVFLIILHKKTAMRWGFQWTLYSLFFLMGWWRTELQDIKNQPNHFSHYLKNDTYKTFQVLEILNHTSYQDRYKIAILGIDNQKVVGKAHLYLQKDSTQSKLILGKTYGTLLNLTTIPKPLNTHTFDYAKYLALQGVYYQLNGAYPSIWLSPKKHRIYISTKALQWRSIIQLKLKRYLKDPDVFGVINALLLGDKQFISPDLKGDYAAAGAVHLLAVSGLHVGVLFLLLLKVFKPLEKLPHGKLMVGMLIILILWGFAVLAGLSGSVVRAVSMFTFISFGQYFRKERSPVLHALFTSYLILLLVHPFWFFEVGFQLSYMAVLGIVWLQPILYNLLPSFRFTFPRKIGQLLTVSVAATLGTLPLSLYYFHQFPGLFFLSNVLIVPFMAVILGIGILVILLTIIGWLPDILVSFYTGILAAMNQFISCIATQEQFLITHIPFSLEKVLVSYLFIWFFFRWFSDRTYLKLRWTLGAFLLLQGVFLLENWQHIHHKEVVIFQKTKQTLIGEKNGKILMLWASPDTLENEPNFIKSYLLYYACDSLEQHTLDKNVLLVHDKLLLIIDSTGIYEPLQISPDILLLTQSPQIHLENTLHTLHPKLVLADGSNYKSYINRWQKTCKKNKIPFHATSLHGAYTIK